MQTPLCLACGLPNALFALRVLRPAQLSDSDSDSDSNCDCRCRPVRPVPAPTAAPAAAPPDCLFAFAAYLFQTSLHLARRFRGIGGVGLMQNSNEKRCKWEKRGGCRGWGMSSRQNGFRHESGSQNTGRWRWRRDGRAIDLAPSLFMFSAAPLSQPHLASKPTAVEGIA